ncbi:MAG: ABC transporter permease [Gemmatimonadota bacterium]
MTTPGSLYRLLLHLLPGALRESSGPEMEALFLETLERERAARGRRGALAVWGRAATDILRRAPYERWRRRTRPTSGARAMSNLTHDLRFAVRGFFRQPGVTALVILTLTLGIAASSAVFTLLNGLFFRPFPFARPEQLVYLNETAPKWNLEFTSVFYGDFAVWQKESRAFQSMALFTENDVNLWDGTTAERVRGASITRDFGAVLGIRPVVGRFFTADEDRPKGPAVVLLSYGLWRSRFGGASDVVGRTLAINGVAHQVVGVMPPNGEFPAEARLWLPMAGDPNERCCSYSYEGIARLKPGITIEQARADLQHAHGPIWAARDSIHTVSPRLLPLRERLVSDYRLIGSALGIGVVLVLLIACANVASIMLARSIFRQREIGIRVALGATAGRVSRQLFTESLVLAAVAGVSGAVLGRLGLKLLLESMPDRLPSWAQFGADWRIVLFSVGIVGMTAILFGLAPALQNRRQDGRSAMAGGGRASMSVRQRRTLNGLVIAEIALASVLLVASGLLVRAYQRVRNVDPGFRVDNTLSFRLAPPLAKYRNGKEQVAFYQDVIGRLQAIPGVRDVGAVNCPPLGCHLGNFYEAEGAAATNGRGENPVILTLFASPGYFGAIGLKLVSGRFFTPVDGTEGGPTSVIVSEAFARAKWPNVKDPVGRRVRYQGGDSTRWFTVVGVAGDVHHYGLDQPAKPTVIIPMALLAGDSDPPSLALVVHTATEQAALFKSVGDAVRAIDPELPLFQVGTLAASLNRSLALRRAFSWLLAVFGGIALTLAVGGIYAVLSYLIGQRTREIGIRMTLGAERGQVLGLVLRQGLGLVTLGLVIGLPIAFGASRLLSSLLVGVTASDPLTFVGVAIGLVVTGLTAAMIPARRASGVDPKVALSEE